MHAFLGTAWLRDEVGKISGQMEPTTEKQEVVLASGWLLAYWDCCAVQTQAGLRRGCEMAALAVFCCYGDLLPGGVLRIQVYAVLV